MKHKYTHLKVIVLIFLLSGLLNQQTVIAQQAKLDKADKNYHDISYIDAAKIYEDVAGSGFKSVELFERLGNCYYFNAQYIEAEKWYGELFNMGQDVEPKYYLRYSQSLGASGKTDESKIWYDRYLERSGVLNEDLGSTKDYQAIINNNSNRYRFGSVDINTNGIELGSGYNSKQLLVTRNRKKMGSRTIVDGWNGLSYLDIYEVSVDKDGSLGELVKLEGDVNTKKYHESGAVITKDGKTMYFTRNNTSSRVKRGKKEVQHLKIYRAHLVNGKWTNIEDLSINGDNYDTAHPALSPNEDKLYFASNMPQSLGETDLFMVNINKDGSMGRPVNLGSKVNTKGRESFPFISDGDELYFSSDGHYGLGGYDVYYLKLKDNGYEGSLLNVGTPINSPFDDFGYVVKAKKGFVNSNRQEGKGFDDIYWFEQLKNIDDYGNLEISGILRDEVSGEPLEGVAISLLSNNKVVGKVYTDKDGYYTIRPVDPDALYIIKAEKDGYIGDEKFVGKDKGQQEYGFALLQNNPIQVITGDDLAKVLNIVIYFDLDKFDIREDAQVELEKLVSVMKDHSNLTVEVRSYTDSRANNGYNMTLSNKRAKATVEYLVSRGIDRSRLFGKGYGETDLKNKCANGVPCSEYEHQLNRRSEFIIVKNQ